jgi:hypothetical protein
VSTYIFYALLPNLVYVLITSPSLIVRAGQVRWPVSVLAHNGINQREKIQELQGTGCEPGCLACNYQIII